MLSQGLVSSAGQDGSAGPDTPNSPVLHAGTEPATNRSLLPWPGFAAVTVSREVSSNAEATLCPLCAPLHPFSPTAPRVAAGICL